MTACDTVVLSGREIPDKNKRTPHRVRVSQCGCRMGRAEIGLLQPPPGSRLGGAACFRESGLPAGVHLVQRC